MQRVVWDVLRMVRVVGEGGGRGSGKVKVKARRVDEEPGSVDGRVFSDCWAAREVVSVLVERVVVVAVEG